MFVTAKLIDCRHYYWSKAFPLYGRNYDAVLRGIEKMEKDLPGLFYAGKFRPVIVSILPTLSVLSYLSAPTLLNDSYNSETNFVNKLLVINAMEASKALS